MLVIDDDPRTLETLSEILASEGFDPHTESNGRDGIEAASRLDPDVILLDHQLPDIDGLEVLDRFREARIQVPVVAITGHGDAEVATRFLTHGAVDYLPKNQVTPERLLEAVERAVWVITGDEALTPDGPTEPKLDPPDAGKQGRPEAVHRVLVHTGDPELEAMVDAGLDALDDTARTVLAPDPDAVEPIARSQPIHAVLVDLRPAGDPHRLMAALLAASDTPVIAIHASTDRPTLAKGDESRVAWIPAAALTSERLAARMQEAFHGSQPPAP